MQRKGNVNIAHFCKFKEKDIFNSATAVALSKSHDENKRKSVISSDFQ